MEKGKIRHILQYPGLQQFRKRKGYLLTEKGTQEVFNAFGSMWRPDQDFWRQPGLVSHRLVGER